MTERELLEWLAREDDGAPYGECHGKTLDNLLAQRLVQRDPVPDGVHPYYARVTVTEAGFQALKKGSST